MREVKLKPCPFCGGEAGLRHYEDFNKDFSSVYKFYVWCKDCEVQSMPTANVERAINAWNTRKPMDDIVEQLKKKREQCFDSSSKIEETGNIIIADRYFYKAMGLVNAIQIVKGGVEDGETHD